MKRRQSSEALCDTTYRCNASSAEAAVKEHFGCERAHIRVMNNALVKHYNDNITLWRTGDKLPKLPFAVGLFYKRTQQMLPVCIINNMPFSESGRITIRDLRSRNDTMDEQVALSDIIAWVIEYMASIDIRDIVMDSRKKFIARTFIWNVCDPQLIQSLKKIEATLDPATNAPIQNVKKINFKHDFLKTTTNWAWINEWIQQRERDESEKASSA